MQARHALWMVGLGALVGCTGHGAMLGHTAQGNAVEIAATSLTVHELAPIPDGARVVPDPDNNRFLVISSRADQPYGFGQRLSCAAASPVRVGNDIGCWAAASASMSAPLVEHVYVPLDAALRDVADAALARAPVVALAATDEHGSFACGAASAEHRRVVKRFDHDIGAELAVSAQRPVKAIATYAGARFLALVPAGAMGAPAQLAVPQRHPAATKRVEDPAMGMPPPQTTKCTCESFGSCPIAVDTEHTKACDATNCDACSLSF